MNERIVALVHESDRERAVAVAESEVFTPLRKRGTYDTIATSGDQTARAETEAGSQLIQEAWEHTVNSYQENFSRVREFLEENQASAFWEDGEVHPEYLGAFRGIAEFEGPNTYLFDQAGDGIRDHDHLELILGGYDPLVDETTENPYQELELYVIPASVSY